ncbi:hypothetical protein C8J44_3471 [Sphingomonas sp. PP-CE-3A-406]|uniref:STN domain-containing protein n=1 Tax=Sphingomonas sp. PP-CE-3A-406 TaxID=2135659 RepID=UPI000F1A7FBE|nr:STN domain-containing protein [Sphingomonas sp. PP-CE-3A-406]RMB52436.1 hypothetical protein C8J44_3471 [Sphingomonas sp. PP-CE-3A-406]
MFRFLTTTAIVAVVAVPVAASAQAQAASVAFDIKASDTATALNAFARQAGVHVSFPYDAVANRRSTALRGRFTRGEALRRLIAGQGLMIAEETPSMISLKVTPVETPQDSTDAATTSTPGQDIVVLGQGQSRQVQTVSAKAMAKLTGGSSPLRSLGRLPGVNFDSSDAHGTYEAATQLSIRGFLTDQMGFRRTVMSASGSNSTGSRSSRPARLPVPTGTGRSSARRRAIPTSRSPVVRWKAGTGPMASRVSIDRMCRSESDVRKAPRSGAGRKP